MLNRVDIGIASKVEALAKELEHETVVIEDRLGVPELDAGMGLISTNNPALALLVDASSLDMSSPQDNVKRKTDISNFLCTQ